MRDIQTIFNLIIEKNIYTFNQTDDEYSSRFMCIALNVAYELGVITWDEYITSCEAIGKYLNIYGVKTLSRVVHPVDKNCMTEEVFEACKSIYLDWENRPMPKEQGI